MSIPFGSLNNSKYVQDTLDNGNIENLKIQTNGLSAAIAVISGNKISVKSGSTDLSVEKAAAATKADVADKATRIHVDGAKGSSTKPIWINQNGDISECGRSISSASEISTAIKLSEYTLKTLSATADRLGLIRVNYGDKHKTEQKYPVTLDDNANAYVQIPWIDSVVSAAKYLPDTKQIEISFKTTDTKNPITPICCDVAGLVDEYYADEDTLKLETKDKKKTFSVKKEYAMLSDIVKTKVDAAVSADKLTVDAGSNLKPTYFTNGVPTECGWNLISSAIIDGAGNAITDIKVDNAKGQISATKGATFLTSYVDTTYTFSGGTNCISVTPSSGSTQKVTVTPYIANNITGTGESSYIAKFNDVSSLTKLAKIDTTSNGTYLNNSGNWSTPPDTKNTAGASNKQSTKLYLVGAESQNASTTTSSNANCYIGTDNCLYSNNQKVLTTYSDTNVKQDPSTDNKTYPLLACKTANQTATVTDTTIFGTGIKINPATSAVIATAFNGTADQADKVKCVGIGSSNDYVQLSVCTTAPTTETAQDGILYLVVES